MGCSSSIPSILSSSVYIEEDDYTKLSEEVKETIRQDIIVFTIFTMRDYNNNSIIIPSRGILEVSPHGPDLIYDKKYFSIRSFIEKDDKIFNIIKKIIKETIKHPFIINFNESGFFNYITYTYELYNYEIYNSLPSYLNDSIVNRYDLKFINDKTKFTMNGFKIDIIEVNLPEEKT